MSPLVSNEGRTTYKERKLILSTPPGGATDPRSCAQHQFHLEVTLLHFIQSIQIEGMS